MLAEVRLRQEIQEITETRHNPDDLHKFLELVKNLAGAYSLANHAEKQCIARIATSNRTVRGRTVELEPSDWLRDIQHAANVKFGGPSRGTARTFVDTLAELACRKCLSDLLGGNRKTRSIEPHHSGLVVRT